MFLKTSARSDFRIAVVSFESFLRLKRKINPQKTNSRTEEKDRSVCSQLHSNTSSMCDASIQSLLPFNQYRKYAKYSLFCTGSLIWTAFSLPACFLFFVTNSSCDRWTLPQYKSFQCRVSSLLRHFIDQNQWDNDALTDPTMLGPFVSLVFLLVQKGSVSIFYWSSWTHHTVEALCCLLMHKHEQTISIIQRENAFIKRKREFTDERWVYFI